MKTLYTQKNFKFNLNYFSILHYLLLIGLILLPLLVSAQSSTSTARTPGAPAGSYKLSDDDSINLFTGNLNYNLPLLSIGGRGEVQSSLSVAIEKQWNVKTIDIGNGFYQHEYNSYEPYNSFVGSVRLDRTTFLTEEPCDDSANRWVEYTVSISYVEADGTEHTLRDRQEHGKPFRICGGYGGGNLGNIFESTSGDNITFIADSDIYGYCYNIPNCTNRMDGYLYFKNGIKARVTAGGVGFIGYVDWIKDRNGNKIQYDYEDDPGLTGGKRIIKITDTLGREINFAYDVNEGTPYGICTKISYDGFGGGQQNKRIIRISHDTDLSHLLRNTQPYDSASLIPIVYDDPNDSVYITGNLGTSYFVKAVWLPDGRSYQFKYNVLGQLARIDLPTGGAIEYDFADVAQLPFENPPNQGVEPVITNRVSEKRVYDSGNILLNKTTFSNPTTYTSGVIPGNRGGTVRDVELFDPSSHRLAKSRHYFYGAPDARYGMTAPWWHGKEFRTEIFESNGTSILRVNEQDWRQRIPSWCLAYWPCSSNPTEVSPTNSPFVVETRTTLSDSNLVMKTTSVNPSTGEWAFDGFNNQTDVWEYDYGTGAPGSLKRHTHTDFVTNTNYTSFTGAYLLGLPSQIWVSGDASGTTKASLTQFEYDNYAGGNNAALVSRTSVAGHDTTNYGTAKTNRGNVTKVTSYGDAQNQTGAVSVYSNYDILGNVVKTIDAKGNATTIDYTDRFGSPDGEAQSNTAPSYVNGQNTTIYPLNGQSTFAFPTSGTNALNWIIGYAQYDYFTGQPVNTEDLNGVISKTIYNDPLDRPTQSVTAVGTAFERQSSINYRDDLHKIETSSDLNTLNDNLIKSESHYDGLGRTVETIKYEADGGYVTTKSVPFAVIQDPETNIWRAATKVSNPYRPLKNETLYWTTSLADSLGRSIKTITPDGAMVKTAYSGNTVTVTDQAGKQRRLITNALGQLTRVDEPDVNNGNILGTIDAPNQPTYYDYDILNNLTTVKQGGTLTNPVQTRSFQYDSLSRLKSANNPESGTISYVYDNNGNLSSKTDARSLTTTYAYDALNRVTSRDYSDTVTPDITYTYDDVNVANSRGNLTKISSSVAETRYTAFDAQDRTLSTQQIIDGQTYPFSYTYNLGGDLLTQTYPSGKIVKNDYSNDGELIQVSNQQTQKVYANSFSYSAHGKVEKMRFGNGKWETTHFNSALQITQIGLGHSATDTGLWKTNYEYGDWESGAINSQKNNGNPARQTFVVPTIGQAAGFTAVQNYTYDSLDRLKSAEETVGGVQKWKQAFLYDRYTNRNFDTANTTLQSLESNVPKVVNPEIDATQAKNQYKQDQDNDGQADYLYDAGGNLTKDAQNRTFTYDAENRQTTATGSNLSMTYSYDGNGKRVKTFNAVTNQTTVFVYDTDGDLAAEYTLNVPAPQNPTISYLTEDALGSVRVTTDSFGQIKARRDFLPFGEEIYAGNGNRTANQSYSSNADDTRKKFATYQRDAETNLDFAQSRYYSPMQGRFTSPDEFKGGPDELFDFAEDASDNPTFYADLENPQSLNKYQYTYNNPYKYNDPDGHCPLCALGVMEEVLARPLIGRPIAVPEPVVAPKPWIGPGVTVIPPLIEPFPLRVPQTVSVPGRVSSSAQVLPRTRVTTPRNTGKTYPTRKEALEASKSGRNRPKPTPKKDSPKRANWERNQKKADQPENHPEARKTGWKKPHFHDQRKPESQQQNYKNQGRPTNNHFYY